jgi:hypothetical protein
MRVLSLPRLLRARPAGLALAAFLAISLCAAGAAESRTLTFSKKRLLTGPYENAVVGDLDRDGNLDIVSGPNWFPGPDFTPHAYRANHVSSDYMHEDSVHLYDVDGDGWLDIIACGWGEDGIYWYKNPGNSHAEAGKPWDMHEPWKAQLLTKTRGFMEMFVMHDYDGDGVPELRSACYRRQEPLEIFRFTKSADGAIALKPFVLGVEGGGHGIAFGDVNGDGREDTLCEIGWYERPAGDIWAGPWKYHPETNLSAMHPSCPFAVKDLNKDGRLDLVFGRGHNVGLYWWEQLAPAADGATQWKQHVIDESWSQAHCLQFADLDGDGEDELVAGKCIWAHNGGDPGAAEPPVVYYYKWDAATASFIRHTIAERGEGIGLNREFAVVDLNKDGRPDIVAPSKRELWVFFNEGYK